MKRQCLIILTAILTTFWGCSDDRKFPVVTKLVAYKQTEFLPTLEHDISKGKNAVYSATLLFAWDEIRKEVEQPIDIANSHTDLTLLNNSKSFMKVLHSNEYNVIGEVDGEVI